MESTVFLNTTLRALRGALTANAAPLIVARLQASLSITVKPFATGDAAAALLEGSPTFRVAIKEDPTDTAFVLTSSFTTGEDGYTFTFASVDSAALRTALGDLDSIEATFEIEWTLGGTVERASCPVRIDNAWIRTTDGPPDPTAEASEIWLRERAVRFDEVQTLTAAQAAQALANQKITFTASGYLRLVNAAGDVFHLALNSGEPPA